VIENPKSPYIHFPITLPNVRTLQQEAAQQEKETETWQWQWQWHAASFSQYP
jgi:hypothetical protein